MSEPHPAPLVPVTLADFATPAARGPLTVEEIVLAWIFLREFDFEPTFGLNPDRAAAAAGRAVERVKLLLPAFGAFRRALESPPPAAGK